MVGVTCYCVAGRNLCCVAVHGSRDKYVLQPMVGVTCTVQQVWSGAVLLCMTCEVSTVILARSAVSFIPVLMQMRLT